MPAIMNGANDPPATRTVVNPLTETEAREFISAQVKSELDKYKKRLFAIFGITNVVRDDNRRAGDCRHVVHDPKRGDFNGYNHSHNHSYHPGYSNNWNGTTN